MVVMRASVSACSTFPVVCTLKCIGVMKSVFLLGLFFVSVLRVKALIYSFFSFPRHRESIKEGG